MIVESHETQSSNEGNSRNETLTLDTEQTMKLE